MLVKKPSGFSLGKKGGDPVLRTRSYNQGRPHKKGGKGRPSLIEGGASTKEHLPFYQGGKNPFLWEKPTM